MLVCILDSTTKNSVFDYKQTKRYANTTFDIKLIVTPKSEVEFRKNNFITYNANRAVTTQSKTSRKAKTISGHR